MSRILRYLLTIVLIIAAVMWVLVVYRSCQNPPKTDNTELTNSDTSGESSLDGTSDEDDLEKLYTDEDDEDGEDDEEEGLDGGTDDEDEDDETETASTTSDNEDESDDEDKDVAYNGIDNTNSKPTSSTSTSVDRAGDEGGEFLVVAGAFVSESNARKYQRRLERKGYDSEVRIFLGSDYHSVIAGAYSSEASAQDIADELGGQAYVHKKRYLKKR